MGIPQRRCVACGRLAERTEFWRIVRCWPDRTIRVDQGMGRSAYLCPTPDCLKLARQKKCLERALRCPIPATVFDLLANRLAAPSGTATSAPPSEKN